MKKIIALTAALTMSAAMLTGCGAKLEGKWTLTDKDGEPTSMSVKFKEDDKVVLNGHKGKWERVDKDTIKFKGFDDDALNGKFDFEIVNSKEKHIYIEDVSEQLEESGKETLYNSAASSLNKAINTALVELDEEGYYSSAGFVISSDDSLCYNVDALKDDKGTEIDMDKFYDKVENYFDEYDEYEFAAYIKNGICYAVCVAGKLDSTVVGTYPGASEGLVDPETYEEVYKSGEFTLEDAADYFRDLARESN